MVINLKSYLVEVCGQSHTGLIRDNNEDAWVAEPENNIFVLADGMGGHTAGEIAAQEAVHAFSKFVKERFAKFTDFNIPVVSQHMRELIINVNHCVYSLGQKDRELKGMGTTLCCVYFIESSMILGHVGDSRIYLLREQKLTQLTEDHSLVAELLELGELNQRQAREYAYRNIITKAIGAEQEVEPGIQVVGLNVGDQILMCSDGLSDMLLRQEIEKIMNSKLSIEGTVKSLVDSANKRGGHDNITVVLMKIYDKNEKRPI